MRSHNYTVVVEAKGTDVAKCINFASDTLVIKQQLEFREALISLASICSSCSEPTRKEQSGMLNSGDAVL